MSTSAIWACAPLVPRTVLLVLTILGFALLVRRALILLLEITSASARVIRISGHRRHAQRSSTAVQLNSMTAGTTVGLVHPSALSAQLTTNAHHV
jgi:hypothetical protein